MRYSSARFVVRYSMRVLLVIVIMFTVSMLFCCMEDNDRYGLNLNEKLHQSKRGIKVRHDLKNLSLLKQKGIWTKLHEHVHHFDGHGTSTEFNISHMKVLYILCLYEAQISGEHLQDHCSSGYDMELSTEYQKCNMINNGTEKMESGTLKDKQMPDVARGDLFTEVNLKVVRDTVKLPHAVYDEQPLDAPGENGVAVEIDKDSLSSSERKQWDQGIARFGYNSYVSDKVSVKRHLPDIRLKGCPRSFRSDLPDTSIVVCFHNEAWSVLLRLVHSVLAMSPKKLLKEIILFDDFSNMDHLGKPLEQYLSKLQKVRLIRAKERLGLIKARSVAMDEARASTITILDSQCECYPGWLEPLLDRIASDGNVVVAPMIDVISKDTFAFWKPEFEQIGGIHIPTVEFKWLPMTTARRKDHQPHEPFKTPAIAGGLFTVSREFFQKTGKYDEDMEIWGAENVEFSLRTWMCGGSMEKHPCSQVGHVYRYQSPYNWGRDIRKILRKNHVRVAEVWLDEYKRYYYKTIGNKLGDYGDVSARLQLRKDLKCKSFQWYLDNVFPEYKMWLPLKTVAEGQVRRQKKILCLDSMQFDAGGRPAAAVPCHGQLGAQFWMLTVNNDIRMKEGCLDYSKISKSVVVIHCSNKLSQKWRKKGHHLFHQESKQCLGIKGVPGPNNLVLRKCSDDQSQIWKIVT